MVIKGGDGRLVYYDNLNIHKGVGANLLTKFWIHNLSVYLMLVDGYITNVT